MTFRKRKLASFLSCLFSVVFPFTTFSNSVSGVQLAAEVDPGAERLSEGPLPPLGRPPRARRPHRGTHTTRRNPDEPVETEDVAAYYCKSKLFSPNAS